MAEDAGDSIAAMEPLGISDTSRHRAALAELAFELTQKSASFKGSLQPTIVTSLANLVRSMNCYYSNLIEGHDTHPIDIERALNSDFSADPKKRDLQLEAKAHISVQKWIDDGGLMGNSGVTENGIKEIHKRFYDEVPEELKFAVNPDTGERIRVIGGQYRANYVQVGRLVPISAGAIPRFMKRFEDYYSKLPKLETVMSAAAAHHRLAWIHPFNDGNGRVTRLMSHAMLSNALDTGAIWSISRGLARNSDRYKALLAACDMTRRNDLDGRGTLSEESLAEFTSFFLRVCIDQVEFMEGLMQPKTLQTRIKMWVEEEIRLGNLNQKSGLILDALLFNRGELGRGEVAGIIGVEDRHARRIVSPLIEAGIISSESSRAPLKLSFPAKLASRLMPGLFPDRVD
ncbi:MAG: Fic family protein [Hyphomonadaceae bacterium]|jgi:Fic family protein